MRTRCLFHGKSNALHRRIFVGARLCYLAQKGAKKKMSAGTYCYEFDWINVDIASDGFPLSDFFWIIFNKDNNSSNEDSQ